VFLLSPKSCTNPWRDSGDRELDLGELTHGCCSSPSGPALPVRPVLLIGVTGVEAQWVLPQVNIRVSLLLSLCAAILSLGQFGAR
jgi:hypothetical protein